VTDKHKGADWLLYQLKQQGKPLSKFGARLADILGQIFQGIYHIADQVCAADWSSEEFVVLEASSGWMAAMGTYDCSRLALLVIACHEACIRMEITPRLIPWDDGLADADERVAKTKELLALQPPQDATVKKLKQILGQRILSGRQKLRAIREALVHHDTRWAELQELADPADERQQARHLMEAVDDAGHDPQDILGQPALHLLFTPRARAGQCVSTRHPTIEEAVTLTRRLLEPIKEAVYADVPPGTSGQSGSGNAGADHQPPAVNPVAGPQSDG
jgi:hypothetical protein